MKYEIYRKRFYSIAKLSGNQVWNTEILRIHTHWSFILSQNYIKWKPGLKYWNTKNPPIEVLFSAKLNLETRFEILKSRICTQWGLFYRKIKSGNQVWNTEILRIHTHWSFIISQNYIKWKPGLKYWNTKNALPLKF